MTDITDQELRDAIEWGRRNEYSGDPAEANAAIVILATVDAPAPTLAEELREWAEDASYDEDRDNLLHAATRAEQIEQDRDEARAMLHEGKTAAEWMGAYEEAEQERIEARAEVERLTEERDRIANGRNVTYAEVDGKPVQKGAESNKETPDPADVPPGEAWIVECRGERRNAVKDNCLDIPWNTINADGWYLSEDNGDVTPIARLVPAPRVITNPDELDTLAEGTIVRDKDGDAWRRTCDEWTTTADYGRFTSWAVSRSGPVTVLWEPDA
jgi:hypothetical protein